MSQKNALIIDSDREVALAVAAAVRSDGIKVGIADLDQDVIDRITSERPDVVCLRVELSGSESGYTLCAKIKRSQELSNIAIFLYSSDASDEAFEAHKKQDTRANQYLRISSDAPFPEEGFRECVRTILFPQGTGAVPPPLPPARTPTPTPTAPSDEDTNFISDLTESLDSKPEPASSGPPRRFGSIDGLGGRGGAMADAKVEMLRQKLKQRESELKRSVEINRRMSGELHIFNEKLDEKDVENRFLEERAQELQVALEKIAAELERRTGEFKSTFQQFHADAETDRERTALQEKELIETVAAKEQALSVLNTERDRIETEAAQKQSEFSQKLAELEQAKTGVEAQLDQLGAEAADLDDLKIELETDLKSASERYAAIEKERDTGLALCAEQEQRLADLDQTVVELRGDITAGSNAFSEQTQSHATELAARDEATAILRSDIESQQANFGQVEADLSQQIQGLTSTLEDTQLELELERESLVEKANHYESQIATGEANIAALEATLEQNNADSESEREEWAKAEGDLSSQLESLNAELAGLEDAKNEAESEAENRERELRNEILSLKAKSEGLAESLSFARDEAENSSAEFEEKFSNLESSLAAAAHQSSEDISGLESAVAGLSQELDEAKEKHQADAELQASMEQELADEQSVIGELRDALAQETAKRAQTEDDLSRLRDQLESSGVELETTVDMLKETEQELNRARETLALKEGRLTEFQETLQKETAAHEQSQIELAELRASFATRTADVGRLEGKIDVLEESIQDARAQKDAMATEMAAVRERLMGQESELATARAEANERGSRMADLSQTLNQKESELAAHRVQIHELEDSVHGLTDERRQLQIDKVTLSESLESEKMSMEQLAADHDEAELRIEKLQASVDEGDALNIGLKEQVTELEQTASVLVSNQASLQAELAQSVEDLDRKLTEFTQSKSAWDTMRQGMRESLEQIDEQLLASETALENVQADKIELSEALDQARESNQSLSQAKVEVQNRLDSNQIEYETATVDLNAMLDDTRASLSALEAQAQSDEAETQLQLTQLRAALDEGQSERSQLRSELEGSLSASQHEAEQLGHDLSLSQAERDKDERRFQEQIADVSRRLHDTAEELATIKGAGRATDHIIEAAHAETRIKEAEVLSLREAAKALELDFENQLMQVQEGLEEQETQYLKELEQVHDEYDSRLAGVDDEHRLELDSLRSSALDAKRQLKASELQAKRLEEQLRKSEFERPSKSGAEEDFDKFMRTYVGSKPSKRGASSSRPRSAGSNRPRPSKSRPPASDDSTRPSKEPARRDSLLIEISDLEIPIEIRDSEISAAGMLGSAGVADSDSGHESDETIIAPLADELIEILGIPERADEDFTEGEDFLRSVTEEFEKE